MKSVIVVALLSLGTLAAGSSQAQEAVAKSAGCLNCHAADTKKVGPSFKDIAAKYKGQAGAEANLVEKIKSGKGHPASKASDSDIKGVISWILSM
ncbi:MAG TPA: c-type cytochrome [Casimicrobiaceae bacterium]|jgi:cytochrome c